MATQQATIMKSGAVEAANPMERLWTEAYELFQDLTKESIFKGRINNFTDVEKAIEDAGRQGSNAEPSSEGKMNKTKDYGLDSLYYLKALVSVVSTASSTLPMPEAATGAICNVLVFVLDIPQKIVDYRDAINGVFEQLSSRLSQFKIYKSMIDVSPLLLEQIHQVLISFVKLCTYVVKYKQDTASHKFRTHIKDIFTREGTGFQAELARFTTVTQRLNEVEGTITLATALETKENVSQLGLDFKGFANDKGQKIDEMHKYLQASEKRLQRVIALEKIIKTFGLSSRPNVDSLTPQSYADVSGKWLKGTGDWIFKEKSYEDWVSDTSIAAHVLVLKGSPTSGKTFLSVFVAKQLDNANSRVYVAHHSFPIGAKKFEAENNRIQAALKDVAVQLACAGENSVFKALSDGKSCKTAASLLSSDESLENLFEAWPYLGIGSSGTNATYYIFLDGIENLGEQKSAMLLSLLHKIQPKKAKNRRVRFFITGPDAAFPEKSELDLSMRIQMEERNKKDMKVFVRDALDKEEKLVDADIDQARDLIIEKLPGNVGGDYSLLKNNLDSVLSYLVAGRFKIEDLKEMLDRKSDRKYGGRGLAIQDMQQFLKPRDIEEIKEILKWVIFGAAYVTMDQLESALVYSTGARSLSSLKYSIEGKYSAVLKLEDGYVQAQEGVEECVQQVAKPLDARMSPQEGPKISMTITINNVDQRNCAHFLWDLTQMAMRDDFRFFQSESISTVHREGTSAIALDALNTNRDIVLQVFKYLSGEPTERTREIGLYMICWLPFHLHKIREPENDTRELTRPDKEKIGKALYELFANGTIIERHKSSFSQTMWTQSEMLEIKVWLTDSAAMGKVEDEQWKHDMTQNAMDLSKGFLKYLVKLVLKGLLKERVWDVKNAWRWLEQFAELDDQLQARLYKNGQSNDADDYEVGSSTTNTGTNWKALSRWCQKMLGLNDSDLDSLWYERLAETCHYVQDDYDTALELYESSIAKPNHNWLCYRRMGEICHAKDRTQEAIKHMEQALVELEGNALDKSGHEDAFEMRLLLGQYNYEAGELDEAASFYSKVCDSPAAEHVVQARLGLMRVQLHFGGDADGLSALVEDMREKAWKGHMNSLLQHMALELDHQSLLLNMLNAVSQSSGLLQYVLETSQETLDPDKLTSPENFAPGTQISEISSTKRKEAQGILLFYTGLATMKHRASLNQEQWSLRKVSGLWQQSVRQLLDCDSPNASFARMNVISALASHYFGIAMQAMLSKDDDRLRENLNAIERLYLEDSSGVSDEPSGLLGLLYALRENQEKSKEKLTPMIKQGLQILYDNTPDNDRMGFCYLQKALEHFQDFENAAIAFSLAGPTDLVSEALQIVTKDVEKALEGSREAVEKECTLELATHMRKEMIQTVQERIPSMSDQARRIEAAREHLDLIQSSAFPSALTKSTYDIMVGKYSPETVEAASGVICGFIEKQISILEEAHTWRLSTEGWRCDGRSANGQPCPNESNFATEFYHCVFCSARDFCRGCLERVRNGHPDLVTVCSAKHKWLRMPPHGDEVFVGPRSKTVRKAIRMHETEGDRSILTVTCAENETEELDVEDWKRMIANQWGIPLSAVRPHAESDP